jgi:hypothetical protein
MTRPDDEEPASGPFIDMETGVVRRTLRQIDENKIVRRIYKPGDRYGFESARRTARRRAIVERNQENLEKWRKSKWRWDNGSSSIRKSDLEMVTHPIRCVRCGNWFPSPRSDAKTCGPTCRTAMYRKRKVERISAATEMKKRYQLKRLPMFEPWQMVDFDPRDASDVYDNYWLALAEKLKRNERDH